MEICNYLHIYIFMAVSVFRMAMKYIMRDYVLNLNPKRRNMRFPRTGLYVPILYNHLGYLRLCFPAETVNNTIAFTISKHVVYIIYSAGYTNKRELHNSL